MTEDDLELFDQLDEVGKLIVTDATNDAE